MIQYFYTLTYPEETTDDIEHDERASAGAQTNGSMDVDSGPNDRELLPMEEPDAIEAAVEDEEANQDGSMQGSTNDQSELDAEQLQARELLLSSLDQDLQVYVLADKYGIPDLKRKAARHFENQLTDTYWPSTSSALSGASTQ